MNFIEQFKSDVKALVDRYKSTKFADVKAADGTILRYAGDTPQVGMPINIVTEEGELAAPDAEYTLEDGSVIVVKGGVIAEVRPKTEENPDDMGQANTGAQTQTADKSPKEIVESVVTEYRFKEQIDELKTAIETANKEIETLKAQNETFKAESEKASRFQKEIFDLVEKLGNESQQKPAERQRSGIFAKKDEGANPMKDQLEKAAKLLRDK